MNRKYVVERPSFEKDSIEAENAVVNDHALWFFSSIQSTTQELIVAYPPGQWLKMYEVQEFPS